MPTYTATYKAPADEIGDAIRDWIQDQLGTSMSLVTCERGSYVWFAAELPLTDQLPAVFVGWTGTELGHGDGAAFRKWNASFDYLITYVQAIGDTDHPERPVVAAIHEIMDELNKDDQSIPDFSEDGFQLQKITAHSARPGEGFPVEDSSMFLAEAFLEVRVTGFLGAI